MLDRIDPGRREHLGARPGIRPTRTPQGGLHTYASLMIAAGVNAKALSTFMGHAKISITLDRYGHPMPGSERRAARGWRARPMNRLSKPISHYPAQSWTIWNT
jgi:integrase